MQQDKLEPSTLIHLLFSSSWMFLEGKTFSTIVIEGKVIPKCKEEVRPFRAVLCNQRILTASECLGCLCKHIELLKLGLD